MAVTYIADYIIEKVDSGMSGYEIADELGVSVSMVSSYKHNNYNPSIGVAKKVYVDTNIVLHPFSEESLKIEITKDR